MKIAIAHDYLTQFGGVERVVLSLMKAFPDAPIFTTVYNPETTFPEFKSADVRVSPLNRLALARKDPRLALPLLPWASSSISINADLVVASSTGWAHGFRTNGRKLVYCHNPARWLYQADEYLGESPAPVAAALKTVGPALRIWDKHAAREASAYCANSSVVQQRIRTTYGIEAELIFPPFQALDAQTPIRPTELSDDAPYHLLVSRLKPYKNVDRAIEAFRGTPRKLVIVGAGPLEKELRSAAPDNVVMLKGISDGELQWLYANAVALIAPSLEDFGLTVLEAGAHGTPTLALRAGGYLDTVTEDVSGRFFERPDAMSIRAAVEEHAARPLPRPGVTEAMERFNEATFITTIRHKADEVLAHA